MPWPEEREVLGQVLPAGGRQRTDRFDTRPLLLQKYSEAAQSLEPHEVQHGHRVGAQVGLGQAALPQPAQHAVESQAFEPSGLGDQGYRL